MFIKPVSGRQVHDPDRGDLLPEVGREVVPHQYWLRRIADGDVVEAEAPTESKSLTAAEAK